MLSPKHKEFWVNKRSLALVAVVALLVLAVVGWMQTNKKKPQSQTAATNAGQSAAVKESLQQATAAMASKKPDDAEEALKKAADASSDKDEKYGILLSLASLQMQQGRFPEAITSYNQAKDTEGKDQIADALGRANAEAGEFYSANAKGAPDSFVKNAAANKAAAINDYSLSLTLTTDASLKASINTRLAGLRSGR